MSLIKNLLIGGSIVGTAMVFYKVGKFMGMIYGTTLCEVWDDIDKKGIIEEKDGKLFFNLEEGVKPSMKNFKAMKDLVIVGAIKLCINSEEENKTAKVFQKKIDDLKGNGKIFKTVVFDKDKSQILIR